MSETFDIAIVGAGFAGLACAQAAHARGLSAVVIDRKRKPGASMHTTGIIVQEALDIWDVPRHLIREVPKVRLYAPSLRYVDLASPGYAFYATDTPGLLQWYAGETTGKGIDVRFGVPFTGATRDGDFIELDGTGIRAHYLVGADGARSRVAQIFKLGINTHHLIGLEAEYEGVRGVDGDFLHTFLTRKLAPGYIAWLVPTVGGITQVGLACSRKWRPDLEAFVSLSRRIFDFSAARVTSRRSGPIPVGGMVTPIAAPGILLVGDAAGIVSPLTAGGIYTAIHHSRAAANAIADHLSGTGEDPGVAMATTYPRFRWKSLMRRAADIGFPDWSFNAALALPPVRKLAQMVYFHNKGLGSKEAWRDMVAKESAKTGDKV